MSRQNGGFTYKDGVSLKEYIEQCLKDTEKANELAWRVYEVKHQAIENKVDTLSRFLYMGLGFIAALEFILKFFVK
jgi:agmatine/peptidylarginine deiminase